LKRLPFFIGAALKIKEEIIIMSAIKRKLLSGLVLVMMFSSFQVSAEITKITIRAQTFENAGEGKHTIANEFRVGKDDNNELKRTEQNYQTDKMEGINKYFELFDDVKISDWYYSEVEWAYDNNLMQGTNESSFEPDAIVTQGMIVTVLARLAGIDVNAYNGAVFADVPENEWYTPYAKWAKTEKIADHIVFAPNAALAREDMCVIIKKFLDYADVTYTVSEENIVFEDNDLIAEEAKASIQELYNIGIITGRIGNIIAPDEFITRAELATFLHRTDTFIKEHR